MLNKFRRMFFILMLSTSAFTLSAQSTETENADAADSAAKSTETTASKEPEAEPKEKSVAAKEKRPPRAFIPSEEIRADSELALPADI